VTARPTETIRRILGGNLRMTELHHSRAAVKGYGMLRSALAHAGLQVVAKSFYSPIPDLKSLPEGMWTRRSELAGIPFDLDRQLAFLEELTPYIAEFDPPTERPTDPHAYYLHNPSYGPGDAEVLYGIIRHTQPARIIELGSGFTTLVTAQALRANHADGAGGELRVFDPFPGVAGAETPGVTVLERLRAQEVPLERFADLEAGDVLFVDTTHTVKIGGDVNWIVLDVLPRLAPGVLVHFHDIFLPYEYPREWPERYGLFWAEQYLLQAFLAFNSDFEVVCALHALVQTHPKKAAFLIRSLAGGARPGAFWIRRTEARSE
jgi:Methyltransferase domain